MDLKALDFPQMDTKNPICIKFYAYQSETRVYSNTQKWSLKRINTPPCTQYITNNAWKIQRTLHIPKNKKIIQYCIEQRSWTGTSQRNTHL